ncbi:MAG: tetratricopeptide repeat protein [Acidobacteriota bacterium]
MMPGLALFLLGVCLVGIGRLAAQPPSPEQIRTWQSHPEVVRNFQRGRELRRAGKLQEAAAAYKEVLRLAPGLAVAHLNLGLVYHDQRDYPASTASFQRAASLDPNLVEAQLYLGIDAYLWRRYDLAAQALREATRLRGDHAEAFYWLGLTEAQTGNLQNAASSLEQAAQLRPKDEDTLFQLQQVYQQLWKSTYDRLVGANPDSFRIHQILAEGYLQADRLEDAKREYQAVLKANPTTKGVHEPLGDIARRQQRPEEALGEYEAELALSPQEPRIWYKLADVLIDQGAYAKAGESLQECLKLDDRFAPAYSAMGRLARQQGDIEQAVAHYQKALELGLDDALQESTHYQLARLFQKTGDSAQAGRHMKEFQRLEKIRKERALSLAERERSQSQAP